MTIELKNFRPENFGMLFGQDHLQPMLFDWEQNENKIPQQLLISGPYGCGKTTIARILAKKLVTNQNDLKEINAAEARGIDDVRSWIEWSKFSPFGKNKVFIFDELHQLTNAAQSALLKVIEDPPPNVYFFLCTSEKGKLLPMLASRCVSVEVKPFSEEATTDLLTALTKGKLSPELIREIHKRSDGHARDAVKAAEMAMSCGVTSVENFNNSVGISQYQLEQLIIQAIKSNSVSQQLISAIANYTDERSLGFSLDRCIDSEMFSPVIKDKYGEILMIRSNKRVYTITPKEQAFHLFSLLKV